MSSNRFIHLESLFVPRVFISEAHQTLYETRCLFSTTIYPRSEDAKQARGNISSIGRHFHPLISRFASEANSPLYKLPRRGLTLPLTFRAVQINNTPYICCTFIVRDGRIKSVDATARWINNTSSATRPS